MSLSITEASMTRQTDRPLSYRIDSACRALGVGRTKLYALIGAGEIRPIRIGRRVLIPRSELETLLRRLQPEKSR
ncbi:helix-turn-helix domain-containing protein [Chthonobacter rhizosphaerae]|uniref:helix-turn-helix domain-containing protein n=1 Tax=Chthonobacter rhizosphaerae TaxID=2735553 RepID=UPI003CCD3C72